MKLRVSGVARDLNDFKYFLRFIPKSSRNNDLLLKMDDPALFMVQDDDPKTQ